MQLSVLHAQPATEYMKWTVAAKLPPVNANEKALGLAGVFSGVSNNVLLVAGGSYFPDKMPWEGGKKDYVSNIFVLQKTTDGKYTWLPGQRFLKQPVAYGASVSTPLGVVCAGGENQTANSITSAFLLRWDAVGQKVVCKNLPDLPIPLTNACMAVIGSEVYVCGGETKGRPSAGAFSLNLAESNKGWKRLPDMPLAMSHSVAVSQSNGHNQCLYVIGGRSSSPTGISELHSSAFCYNPSTNCWTAIESISDGTKTNNLSASAGVALGNHQIMMVGGDRGEIFHRIETYNRNIADATNEDLRKQLQAEKLEVLTHHPGFSRQILMYDTLTDQWKKVGELPMESHVTTNALVWDGDIFITCGEVRPGIRTPDILKARLPNDIK